MARILIDGREYEVREGDNLLAAALGHGLDLPYFCWHGALGSVGACRQCAVKQYKDESDTRGRLVMACMTAVTEGSRFSIDDKEAREFRASVIEWLMLNHPHDCPVCDEGGECHLQDMTVMTGHVHRRTRFAKRTFVSQDLGPFLNHEMNRCITCYRCVRFYCDYAGGTDLHAFASKDHVYFGRHEDGPLESPYSGNLAEVCPTGVFTDRTLAQHYTRKWDLQSAPSVCVHCGLGCNTFGGERYGTLRRISNRYHGEINRYFLCDRGRFGYEFVNAPERLREPRLRTTAGGYESGKEEAVVHHLAARLGGMRLIGIGSPRASLEDNYALRALVGTENFYSGLAGREHALSTATLKALRQVRTLSLREVEKCDAALVLGEDVEATNPRLALALRRTARNRAFAHARELGIPLWQDASVRDATGGMTTPIHIVSPLPTGLDPIARHGLRRPPGEIVLLAQAIAAQLRGGDETAIPLERRVVAGEIVESLRGATRPVVVAGAVEGSDALVAAAHEIVATLTGLGIEAGFVATAPEANTTAVAVLQGRPLDDLPTGPDVAYLVLQNDLFRRMPAAEATAKSDTAGFVVVLDALPSPTVTCADVVLPTTTFAEQGGVYVNNEGRAQRAFPICAPAPPVQAAWRWLGRIGAALGRGSEWESSSQLLVAAAEEIPELAPLVPALTEPAPPSWRVARQSHRYSGRTAMVADRTMHEPPPPRDWESPLVYSMEGFGGPAPAALIPRYWVPGWNSYQAVNFYQREIGGGIRGGEAGVRLFDAPSRPAEGDAESAVTPAPTAPWIAVPLFELFGSEELSARAPAIAARARSPHVALHPEDAARLGVEEGDTVEIVQEGARWHLRVRLLPMVRGVVAVTAGIVPYLRFHRPVEISRVTGGSVEA